MTNTDSRAFIRGLLNQTSNTNTQFTDTDIDEAVSVARRAFATILPEEILPNLRTGDGDTATPLTATSGYAAFPSDFLRVLKNKYVQVSISGTYTRAIQIKIPYQVDRAKTSTSAMYATTGVAYYRETGAGVEVWPNSATSVKYPYLKTPGELSGSDNTDLPPDVEDMTLLHAFERLMGTKRGDVQLAVKLANDRGYNVKAQNELWNA